MADTVFVCETCCSKGEQPQGAAFAQALRERVADQQDLANTEVRLVSCLNMCDTPLSLALRAPDKVAYLFSGVRPAIDIADAVELLRLYARAKDGVIEDARSAGRLRFCLTGRIPAV